MKVEKGLLGWKDLSGGREGEGIGKRHQLKFSVC